MIEARILVRPAHSGDAEEVSVLLAETYPVLLRDAYSAEVLASALPLVTKSNPRLLSSGNFHVARVTKAKSSDAVVGRSSAPAVMKSSLALATSAISPHIPSGSVAAWDERSCCDAPPKRQQRA